MAAPKGNDYALKYKSEEELSKGIEEYFEDCKKREKPYTMSGLAVWLGIDRTTLINYGMQSEQIEENAIDGTFNTTFAIFSLKANYKWDDGNKVNVSINHPKTEKVEDIVDNSDLEKVLYEENRHSKDAK